MTKKELDVQASTSLVAGRPSDPGATSDRGEFLRRSQGRFHETSLG